MPAKANVISVRKGLPPTLVERKKRAKIIPISSRRFVFAQLKPAQEVEFGFKYLQRRPIQIKGYEIGATINQHGEPRVIIERPQTSTHPFLRLIVRDQPSRELAKLFSQAGFAHENKAAYSEAMLRELAQKFPHKKFVALFNRVLRNKEYELRVVK